MIRCLISEGPYVVSGTIILEEAPGAAQIRPASLLFYQNRIGVLVIGIVLDRPTVLEAAIYFLIWEIGLDIIFIQSGSNRTNVVHGYECTEALGRTPDY